MSKLSDFFSHCDGECLCLLSECSVTEIDSSILMVPPSHKGQDRFEKFGYELMLRRRKFISAAQKSGIKHITIMGRSGKREYSVPQIREGI